MAGQITLSPYSTFFRKTRYSAYIKQVLGNGQYGIWNLENYITICKVSRFDYWTNSEMS